MAEAGAPAGATQGANGGGTTDGGVAVKAGRHREATLYHALHGAGTGDGRTLEQLREAALRVYESQELPVWRRSGFWTTSFEGLDLDALEVRHHAPPRARATDASTGAGTGEPAAEALPKIVRDTLPERPRAGRIVQRDGTVVSVELDAGLAERGVV
ncbi:MAG: hypothetical protein ACRDLF_13715, partial [Solirubrobacteraceae bacterium]